jgi:hypothetical protein
MTPVYSLDAGRWWERHNNSSFHCYIGGTFLRITWNLSRRLGCGDEQAGLGCTLDVNKTSSELAGVRMRGNKVSSSSRLAVQLPPPPPHPLTTSYTAWDPHLMVHDNALFILPDTSMHTNLILFFSSTPTPSQKLSDRRRPPFSFGHAACRVVEMSRSLSKGFHLAWMIKLKY